MLYLQEVSKPGENIIKAIKDVGLSMSAMANVVGIERNLFRYQVCHVKHSTILALSGALKQRAEMMRIIAADLEEMVSKAAPSHGGTPEI